MTRPVANMFRLVIDGAWQIIRPLPNESMPFVNPREGSYEEICHYNHQTQEISNIANISASIGLYPHEEHFNDTRNAFIRVPSIYTHDNNHCIVVALRFMNGFSCPCPSGALGWPCV